jgi:hypothetical protein
MGSWPPLRVMRVFSTDPQCMRDLLAPSNSMEPRLQSRQRWRLQLKVSEAYEESVLVPSWSCEVWLPGVCSVSEPAPGIS